jgi:MFS family permease
MSASSNPPRIFYGWFIVAASFIIGFYIIGIVFYGFTTIFKPIVEEFGWSYASVSLAASLRGVESGLLAPIMGILIDRWGPRRLVFTGGCLAALGLFILSNIQSLFGFYIAFVLIAMAMGTCSITVMMTTISNWFRKRVGLAMSIVSCGFGAGGLVVFVMARLVDSYGWRLTVQWLSFGVLILVLPLSLFLRHKPQQYGYLPDGDVITISQTKEENSTAPVLEYGLTIQQALRQRTFWMVVLIFNCNYMMTGAVITHIMPYLTNVGVTTTLASLAASGIPLASIVGRMGLGALGDRFSRKRLMMIMFFMITCGFVLFQMASTIPLVSIIGFLALFGIGYGGYNATIPAFIRDVFGTRQYGTILGCLVGMAIFGNIAGPYIAGKLFDLQGSYYSAWWLFAAVATVALITLATINEKKPFSDSIV